MRALVAFGFGLVVGAAGYWYLESTPRQGELEGAGAKVAAGAKQLQRRLEKSVGGLDIDAVRDELRRTGMVVRDQAERAGSVLADAASDARISATIKAKLVADHELSAWSIDVNTTDGLVTLSGTVASESQVAQAVQLALQVDGVRKVVSTLQVRM